jgi:molybdate transport system permease protein
VKRRALWLLLGVLVFALMGRSGVQHWIRATLSGDTRASVAEYRWHAAASLGGVWRDLTDFYPFAASRAFSVRHKGSFGSTSQLAQQLLASDAPGIFLSADRSWIDALIEADRVAGEPLLLARNRLVWITPEGPGFRKYQNDADFFRLLENPAMTLVLADDSVPVGRYAREWLDLNDRWVEPSRRARRMGDVTSVLNAVSSGAADLGCVYASDVVGQRFLDGADVEVVYEVDPAATPGIESWGVVLSGSLEHHRDALEFCVSPLGQALFERAGFVPAHPVAENLPAADDEQGWRALKRSGGDSPSAALLEAAWTLATTLRIAVVGVLLVALPAIAIGLSLARRRGPWRTAIAALAQVPLVLPPIAVGLILLQALPKDWLLTPLAASIAAGVMAFPLIVHTSASAFDAVDPRLESMGASLGLSPFAVLRTITLPLASHGLAAALLLGFGRAVGEFGATMLVAGNVPGETQTLALAIWQHATAGEFEQARWPLALSAFVGLLSVALAQLMQNRSRRRGAVDA